MGLQVVDNNIKQQMLPFVLQPSAMINQARSAYKSGGGSPQYFTFKTNTPKNAGGKATLNFCPSSFKTSIDNDLSFRLLYNKQNPTDKSSLTFAKLVDSLPAVSIREFIPDTALDQTINFFTDMLREVMNLFGDDGMSTDALTEKNKKKDASAADSSSKPQADVFDKLKNVMYFVMKYITGGTSPDIITSTLKDAVDAKLNMFQSGPFHSVAEFPYFFYYRLQSCLTTGIYEIPALKTDKKMYTSNGAPGWNTADASLSLLPKSLTSIPGIGSILGKMFGNIAINWMPWWNAITGNGTPEPAVELTFDLYNDTSEAAIANFIFVNTLVPNNKWIQYGLFQHSSHIYDVKLEGYNRLFACTGQFEVTSQGVLRDPPASWFTDGQNGLKKYVNSCLNADQFLAACKDEHLIKIPDIYSVKMVFDSLLPSNFNQYLYTLTANYNQLSKYGNNVYSPSGMSTALTGALKGLIKGAKGAWKQEKDYTKDEKKTT